MSRVEDMKEVVHYRFRAERAEAKFEDLRKRALQAEQRERTAKVQRDHWRGRAERLEVALIDIADGAWNVRHGGGLLTASKFAKQVLGYEGSTHEVE